MRRWIVAFLGVLVGLLGLGLSAQGAQAADTGTISGKITDGKGVGLQYAYVYLYSNGLYANSTSTDSSGNYSLTVSPGSYKVQFWASGYLEEYWDNKANSSAADALTVTSGKTTTANASLAKGGMIAGKLTGPDGKGLQWGNIALYRTSDNYSYTSTNTFAADGSYSFSNLPPGSYKLRFIPPSSSPSAADRAGASPSPSPSPDTSPALLPEFYNNKKTLATADTVTVVSDATTQADAQLAVGPAIKGTVKDDTGTAVSSVSVNVYQVAADGSTNFLTTAYTNAKGAFTTSGMEPGNYKLQFYPQAGHVAEWWKDKGNGSDADVVTVAGTDVTVDPVLASAGQVSGTVTGPDGKAVSNVNVIAQASNGSTTSDVTDSAGLYQIDGLATGSYKVRFNPNYYGSSEYATQWYKGAATEGAATAVAVVGGKTTGGIDAQLTTAGSISGTVTGPDGKPISGVNVNANSDPYGNYGSATTGADGTYKIKGLSNASYRLTFYGPSGGLWLSEYYDDADYSDATMVTVADNAAVTGIDAQLAKGARISGTISNGTSGLTNAYVSADISNSYSYGTGADSSGKWSLVLKPGTYTLRFSASGYISEYWKDVIESKDATKIALAAGDDKTFDAALEKGGSISGTIKADKGTLQSPTVYARKQNTSEYNAYYATVGNDGSYTIAGLPAGTYKVYFYANGFMSEWWDDKPDEASATSITVAKNENVTGKNAVLTKGASVTGKIVDKLGKPVQGAYVYLNGSGWGTGYSQADGTFEVSGLIPGSYRVRFSANGYLDQYYKGVSDYEDAEIVALAKDETKALGTITMAKAAAITGTVKDAVSKAAVSGVRVYAYTADGDDWLKSSYTDATGGYQLAGLPAGSYRLKLIPPNGSQVATQWLDGSAALHGSKRLDLASEQTLVADALMKRGGTISGIVKKPSGVPMADTVVKAVAGSNKYTVVTGVDGKYTITGVAPGKYRVSFTTVDYWKQWYNGEPSKYMADLVSVDFGSSVTGIDATLSDRSFITGTVTGPTGLPVANARVNTYKATGEYSEYRVATTLTDETGTFVTKSLEPGKYDVEVVGMGNPSLATQWYTGVEDRADATSVAVLAGKPTVVNVKMAAAGSVSGKVTDATGTPVGSAEVSVITKGDFWIESTTNPDGTYTVGGLDAGTYKVYVWPSFSNSSLMGQYYKGKYDEASADAVTVVKGKATPNINFTLTKGGSISGKVTAADGTVPAYPDVTAYRKDSAGQWEEYRSAGLKGDGTYTLSGLSPGQYKVEVSAYGYLTQWWNNKATLETADITTVAGEAALTGRDFTLKPSPVVTGKVTTADGGALPAYSYVSASRKYVYSDGEVDWWYGGETRVQPDGTYKLTLPPGEYKLALYSYSGNYMTQFWNNKDTFEAADVLTVAAADLPGKDFVLRRGSTISGTIAFPAGDTTGAYITLYDADGEDVDWAEADVKQPAFQFSGVRPGTYTLRFSGPSLLTEWWQDKATADLATPITVTAGKDVTGLAATLAKGASISGTVTDKDKRPLAADVDVYDKVSGDWVSSRETDPDGKYTAGGLPAGEYLVRFDPDSPDFAVQWFENAPTKASAKTIVLAGNASTVADATLTAGAGLAGTITDEAGQPLVGAAVTVKSDELERSTLSNVRGSYTFSGLPDGSYTVHVTPPTARLDLLPVRDGKADLITGKTAALSFKLTQGATVSGIVKGPGGKPARGIGIDVFDTKTGEKSLTAWSATNGTYRSSGLPAGTYKVRFKPGYYGGDGLVEQWWQNKDTFAAATTVSLTDKQQRTGIDATLKSVGGATPPGPPTAVKAVAGDGKVTVSWTPPVNDGGLAITEYRVWGEQAGSAPAKSRVAPSGAGYAAYCETMGETSCVMEVENGKTYTFWVVAVTDAGISDASDPSAPVTPGGGKPPIAPATVTATAGVQSATVTWSAAATATGYTVTTLPDNSTGCTSSGTSCVVSGLTAGKAYTFKVVARNAHGESPPSVASNSVVPTQPPLGVPPAPTAVKATAGVESATVSWTASATATGYEVTTAADKAVKCNTATTTCVITGLTAGKAYKFTVVASNAAGKSAPSAESPEVVPTGKTLPKPVAPASVTAVAGVESATVSWAAVPTATGYAVFLPDNVPGCSVASTSCVINGLTAGKTYWFTVVASNSAGSSPPSAKSNAIVALSKPIDPGTGGGGGGTPDPGTGGGGVTPDPGTGGGGSDPGTGGGSDPGTGGGTTPQPPGGVTAPRAKVVGKKATMSWSPVQGATSYQVRIVKGKKAGGWKTVSKPVFKAKLKKGKYTVQIRAIGAGGTGPVKSMKVKVKGK